MTTRVLYVLAHGELAGAERATWRFITSHDPQEYAASVFLLNDGPLRDLCRDAGVPIAVLPFRVRFRYPWTIMRAAWHIRQHLKAQGVGLVHTCMAYTHVIARLALLGSGIPSVWFQHGPVGAMVDRVASLLGADAVLSNSQFTKSKHLRSCWRRQEVTVIPLPVPLTWTPAESDVGLKVLVRRQWNIPDDALVFGGVGRLDPCKGFDSMLEGVAPFLREKNARLLIVGGLFAEFHSGYADHLARLAQTLGVREKVIFTGFQSDMKPFYRAMDIYIHGGLEEGLGLTAIEAMNLKVLVIAARAGGLAELVSDGENGYLFAPGNAKDLQQVIQKALETRDGWPRLIENASQRLEQERSVAAMKRSLETVYKKVLGLR